MLICMLSMLQIIINSPIHQEKFRAIQKQHWDAVCLRVRNSRNTDQWQKENPLLDWLEFLWLFWYISTCSDTFLLPLKSFVIADSIIQQQLPPSAEKQATNLTRPPFKLAGNEHWILNGDISKQLFHKLNYFGLSNVLIIRTVTLQNYNLKFCYCCVTCNWIDLFAVLMEVWLRVEFSLCEDYSKTC